MDTSGLEALKTALASDNKYAGWCTIAVFVGLVLEYLKLIWSDRNRLSRHEIAVIVAIGILIAGGVFGEYHYGSSASDIAMQIEGISEQRVAESNAEAKKAEQRTAELNASLADRHLTLDQRKQMLAVLSGLPGTRVMVTYLLNADADAQEYAAEIGSVFRDIPGWTLAAPPPGVSSDQPVYGFAIQSRYASASKMKSIENALAMTGYKVTLWPVKQGQEEIGIYVGRKNLPIAQGSPTPR